MPRLGPHVPLITQAQAFAAGHGEAAEIIGALIERINALTRTIRRVASDTWDDDLDTPLPGEPHEHS